MAQPAKVGNASKGNRSKALLIEAASSVLRERNSVNLTFSELAARSGLNSALVKYHFGNKEGLMFAVLNHNSEDWLPELEKLLARDDLGPEDKMRLHLRGLMKTYAKLPFIQRLHNALMRDTNDENKKRIAEGMIKPIADTQRKIIDEGVALGVFRPIDPMLFYFSSSGAVSFLYTQNDADEVGHDLAAEFFEVIEESVRQMASYRGKILSLEHGDGYDGASTALKVHELRSVARDDVVLPQATLDLLERNVIRFARQRGALSERGLAAKKGLLFYGPPGNGKTHTLHFLFSELKDHSTLLITAEQVGLLEQYMTLARLIQPTLVVLEDVDLIAESRENSSPGQQSLLNRLLNEMDGLKKDAEVMFLMTTNRPEAIESALAARPGRVDQAVEFPPPDASGRRKLVAMYAAGSHLNSDVLEHLVSRTEGVSASFIKELMRRSVQFHLEAKPGAERICLSLNDVDQALDEMLLGGGPLNRILLGAGDFDDGSN